MGRRVGEPVEVKVAPVQEESGCRPSAFIWRSRLYVVREVLSHWSERRAWWHDALDTREDEVAPGAALEQAARESEVWRVEASPGWSFRPGVYELALAGTDAAAPGSWALVQVED